VARHHNRRDRTLGFAISLEVRTVLGLQSEVPFVGPF
jgi:hypothetical protein